MPTYNGYNLINLAIGVLLLLYGIYVLIAPYISDNGAPMAKARVMRGIVVILVGGWFLYLSPVDPDSDTTNTVGMYLAIAVRLGIWRVVWYLIDRHYDPMAGKRQSGAFSKR